MAAMPPRRLGQRIRLVIAVLIVTTLFNVATPVAAAGMPCASTDLITVRTFTIDVSPVRTWYRVGQAAKVAVLVTRPAPEDPLRLGLPLDPPARAPANEVVVGVGIHVGGVFLIAYGRTDDAGKVVVAVKLPRYTPRKTAAVDVYAYRVLTTTPCFTFQEDGFTHRPRVFRVR